MKPRVVAIAQARMGSTRLPGKVMRDLSGKPVIDWVFERLGRASSLHAVVAAIPDLPEDDILCEHLESIGVTTVRGSATDVLARYEKAAEAGGADVVVLITCDCPLIDPEVVDAVVQAFLTDTPVDYCSNALERTYPHGMDTEVFTREVLALANTEAAAAHEREHVTPFIYQHPERFRLRNVEAPEWAARPQYRLTLDEEADLRLLRALTNTIDSNTGLRQIVDMLAADAELATTNSEVLHRWISPIERP
jgi:spore coat polysaccharide biosynthesis protein SpsF